ncbi:MAG: GNAT family N-acetyltransferase [Alphaproteobacteria bacterium]|nr:GNAT family N-acetyltransferase [Alphaproteobacteria bacterium]
MLIHRHGDIDILQIEDEAAAEPYFPSFIGVYQTIFSEPPYNELFYPSDAEAVLRRVLQTPGNISLLATKGPITVVGFGLAVPLSSRRDVARHMQGLLPIRHTFYLAELGVLSRYRGAGLGAQLVQRRLAAIPPGFSNVLLRTSATRNASYEMYLKLGFQDIGVYMEVPSRRTDGRITTDRRLFLSKVLTP